MSELLLNSKNFSLFKNKVFNGKYSEIVDRVISFTACVCVMEIFLLHNNQLRIESVLLNPGWVIYSIWKFTSKSVQTDWFIPSFILVKSKNLINPTFFFVK